MVIQWVSSEKTPKKQHGDVLKIKSPIHVRFFSKRNFPISTLDGKVGWSQHVSNRMEPKHRKFHHIKHTVSNCNVHSCLLCFQDEKGIEAGFFGWHGFFMNPGELFEFFFGGVWRTFTVPLKEKKDPSTSEVMDIFPGRLLFSSHFWRWFSRRRRKKQLMNNKMQEESTPTFGSARLVRNPWATCPSVLECGESRQWSENPDHWLPGFGGLINLFCSLWFEWCKHRFPRKPQGTHNQQIDRFFEKDNWTIVEQLRKNDGVAVAPTKRFRKFRSCSTLLPPCRVEPEMEAEKSRCPRESSRKKP